MLQKLKEKIAYWKEERKEENYWRDLETKKLDEEHQAVTKKIHNLFTDVSNILYNYNLLIQGSRISIFVTVRST